MVHGLAGARVDGADDRRRAARRRTCSGATASAAAASSARSSSCRSCSPTVVVALAFVAILPDGVERGWAPILVAHAFFNVAVVVRIVGTFWASLDPRVGEAAATLGASPLARSARSRRRCSHRRSRRRRRSSSSSRSRRSASSSSSAARGTRRSRPRSTTRPSGSSTCARRRCSRSCSSSASSRRLGRDAPRATARVDRAAPPRAETLRAPRTARDKLVVGASLGGLALFLGLPLAVLVERSLAVGGGHGLDAYEALGRPTSVLLAAPWEAVVNSIVYAAAATLIAWSSAASRRSPLPSRAGASWTAWSCSRSAPRR